MRHYRTCASLAVWLLTLALSASAQEPMPLSADIAAVVTGGSWSSGSIAGTYRVVVRTGGREHVVSYAQVDWIAEPSSYDEEPKVVHSKIASTGSWRLDRPRILKSGTLWRVELDGIETHATPTLRGKWVLRVGGPGELQSNLVTR